MKLTKMQLFLVLIFILAFIVRIVAAYHTHVSTDEMLYSILPLNIISAGRLGVIEQSPVFFYLTDLGYKVLGGVNAISVRSTAILFGALAVLVVYLLSVELFKDKKTALMSAFLFALSGFSLFNNYEMNMAAFFFGLLSLLFFIKALKEESQNIYFAGLFLTLGVLIKSIVLILAPIYAIAWLIHCYKNNLLITRCDDGDYSLNNKTILTLVGLFFIGFILFSPVLIYNYFLYQEKGHTDNYLSQFFGIGELANKGLKSKPWEFSRLVNVTQGIFKELALMDAFLLLCGSIGIFLSFKKKNYHSFILIISVLLLFLIVGGRTGSSPHFLWAALILSVFGGYGSFQVAYWVKNKFKFQHLVLIIVLMILINSFFVLHKIVQQRDNSITLKLREYVQENIPVNAIVILDQRIYDGIYAWVFHDRHYVPGVISNKIFENMELFEGKRIDVPFYYFECGPGTKCGWKEDDFKKIYNSSENLSRELRDVMDYVGEVKAIDTINVYESKTLIEIPLSIYSLIDKTHAFWAYPVGWHYPELAFDTYKTEGIGTIIHFFGLMILYFDVLLALLTIPFVGMLVFRNENEETTGDDHKTVPKTAADASSRTSETEHPQPFYTDSAAEKNDEQPR